MVAGHLLKPRMGNAPIFSIESINVDASADGLDVEKMKGKKYGDLVQELMKLDDAIVDVGAVVTRGADRCCLNWPRCLGIVPSASQHTSTRYERAQS